MLNIPKKDSPLKDWLLYINRIHNKSIDLSLKRIKLVAKNLKLNLSKSFIITVGGTNGKGTTCKLLEEIFVYNKIKVGVYSSPHILKYNERVRVQGKQLNDFYHVNSMYIIEKKRCDISLSYFEFSTLSALYIFQNMNLDVIILEVGMGGRLDATNVIDANISVITSISMDHTEFLGNNISKIAKEKSGIFRPGRIAVIGELKYPKIIDFIAKKNNINLYAYGKDWWWNKSNKNWCWWDVHKKFLDLPIPKIPLQNAATAISAIVKSPFKISKDSLDYGLKKVFLPGRFHIICKSPIKILDVAHNSHAAKYLSLKLREIKYTGKLRAVVGMLLNKDIKNTLLELHEQVDFWYLASLNDIGGASCLYLSQFLSRNKKTFSDVKTAWRQAILESNKNDCILAFGSFKTIAKLLNNKYC